MPLVAKLRSLPQQPPLELAELLLELGFDGLLAAMIQARRPPVSATVTGSTTRNRPRPAGSWSDFTACAATTWR